MHAHFRRLNNLELFSVTKRYLVLISRICVALVALIALFAFANVCAYVYLRPALPDVGSLRDVQLQVPLRVYTRDGRLIAAIGDQRRIPVRYDQLPKKLIQAFLATEDDRFFQHHGVDWQGILRAALANLKAGGIRQGASTITMQVSRDMFLTPRRDMKRKMSEIYISLLMETEFTKEEIFSLYVNKIFLGQRAYGVGAAAEVYFGKTLDQLNIAETATLAGIPTAPSVVNPVVSAEAARVRRTHVLGRMRELNYISQAEYEEANSSPMESRLHGPTIEVDAPYVAEMVRNEMQAKYGDNIYTAGFRVYTTIDARLENAATVALRTGLLEYDRHHGWRGATAKVDLTKVSSTANLELELEEFPVIGGLRPAIVQSVEGKTAKIYVKNLGSVTLPWEKLSWARRELPEEKMDRFPTQASEIFSQGDVIYTVGNTRENLQFVQVPEVQSALVAEDPKDGAVVALVGGFDFFQSKFNRVTQARRQPGSGFKPFVYAAALNSGVDGSLPLITPATVLADEPTKFEYSNRSYAPRDYDPEYHGSVTVREALNYSLNVPAVQLAEMVGFGKVRNLALRAGFNNQLQPTPSLALGAYVATPLEVAGAYTIFADHGEYVAPRCIVAVTDTEGHTIWGNPVSAQRVLDPRVSYLMVSLLESVINRGTGAGARTSGFRLPAAGKTGTSHDGWFAGFTSNLLAVAWVGYDDGRDLDITGAHSALPVWTEFMKRSTGLALYKASKPFNQPVGIETAEIDNLTNLVALADPALTHSEVFIAGTQPFPPGQEQAKDVALGSPSQPETALGERGSPLQANQIVLVSGTSGRKVYVNNGALFSPSPNPASRPPHLTTPAAP
jgi:penicillin-binding protein 1A